MSSNMDTEPKTDVPERVINGQNPTTSGNSLLGERRKNQHLRKRQYGIVPAKIDYIIDQIESGRMAVEIADELGVSPSAISHVVKRHNLTERYREAVEQGTDIIVQRGIAKIRAAAEAGNGNLARAWESVQRSTQWYASKITKTFADKPASQVNVSGQGVTVQLVQFGVADTPHDAVHTVDNDDLADAQDSK